MANTLRVSTRKGLFTFEKNTAGEWRQTGLAFLGDPVTLTMTDPRNGDVYAALNLGHFGVKLHRAAAGGAWEEIAVPKYPQNADGSDGASLSLLWSLEPSNADRPGTIWAGTAPGGLFKSEDRGDSWQLIESLWNRPERADWFGGGYDQPAIHSLFVDPRNSDRVLLAVSCGGVWETGDGGASWEVAKGMRAAYMPPERAYDAAVQDPHHMAFCKAAPDHGWVQHHNGIFRTRDGGRNWTEITDVKPSVFGFAVAVHPSQPDTAWFVPAVKDECRVPVDGRLVVTRTRDGGASFDILNKGLPGADAYDLVYRHALDVDAGGDTVAFGSTTGNLWISENQGDQWRAISTHLPPISGVRFDPA